MKAEWRNKKWCENAVMGWKWVNGEMFLPPWTYKKRSQRHFSEVVSRGRIAFSIPLKALPCNSSGLGEVHGSDTCPLPAELSEPVHTCCVHLSLPQQSQMHRDGHNHLGLGENGMEHSPSCSIQAEPCHWIQINHYDSRPLIWCGCLYLNLPWPASSVNSIISVTK